MRHVGVMIAIESLEGIESYLGSITILKLQEFLCFHPHSASCHLGLNLALGEKGG